MKKIKIVNLLVCSAVLGPAFALAQSNVGVAGNRERGLS